MVNSARPSDEAFRAVQRIDQEERVVDRRNATGGDRLLGDHGNARRDARQRLEDNLLRLMIGDRHRALVGLGFGRDARLVVRHLHASRRPARRAAGPLPICGTRGCPLVRSSVIRVADQRTSVATKASLRQHMAGQPQKNNPFNAPPDAPPLQYGAKHVSRDDMGATGSSWLVWRALVSSRRLRQDPLRTPRASDDRARPAD